MAKVNIKIEGVSYQVEEGMTILEAAKVCGYEIPSLCAFNHGECSNGSCRVCLVEVTGARGLVASCVYPVNEGMDIHIPVAAGIAAVHQTRLGGGSHFFQKALHRQMADQNGIGGPLKLRYAVAPPGGAAPARCAADNAVPITAAYLFSVQFT